MDRSSSSVICKKKKQFYTHFTLIWDSKKLDIKMRLPLFLDELFSKPYEKFYKMPLESPRYLNFRAQFQFRNFKDHFENRLKKYKNGNAMD